MFGLDDAIGFGLKIIDKVIPDPAQKAAAQAELLKESNRASLEEMKQSMSVMLAEAQSSDKWTSRARPMFLYVMYGVIALCFLGGILGIWWPLAMKQAAENISALLAAIPDSLWALFGAGYLGYSAMRSVDKRNVLKAQTK